MTYILYCVLTIMPYQPHAAAYTAFKDFYQEELEANPLYRHLAEALKYASSMPAGQYEEAIADLHEFERICFTNAYIRLDQLSYGHAVEIIRPNDFFFFRSQFKPLASSENADG